MTDTDTLFPQFLEVEAMTKLHPGMTVMVTGATGFVGTAVTRALCAAGYKVIALVRSAERAAHLPSADTRLLVGDLLRPETYQESVREADAVVHAAQYRISGRVTQSKLDALSEANDTATRTLAAACARYGRRFVYTSGCFGYGDRGEDWITEETSLRPSPLGVAHARQVERLRGLYLDGLDAVTLHLGFVYGPGGNFASAFYEQARKNRLRCIGTGENYWSVVHVDDVAQAYVVALERAPAGAEYNVVDDSPLRLRSFVDSVTDVMGRRRVGKVPVGVAGFAIGRPAAETLATSYRVSNAKIRQDLEWSPMFPTVDSGLPWVIEELNSAA